MIQELTVEAYKEMLREQVVIRTTSIIDLDLMPAHHPELAPYHKGRRRVLNETIETCDKKIKVIEARLKEVSGFY